MPSLRKDPADFVDAFHSADDEALEIEFGRDAQLHHLIERIDVRDERPRGGAAGDVQQRRRFDFVKTLRVDEAPHLGQNAAARHEDFAHAGVHDEIHVALAVPFLNVGEAVPLVRQRIHRFGKHFKRKHVQRQLALLRSEHVAVHAHDVADVEHGPVRKLLFADFVAAHVELQLAGAVGQIRKGGLPVRPLRHQPAGERPVFALGLCAGLQEIVFFEQFARVRVDRIARCRKRIVSARTQSGQIFTSGRY